ncbi:MAG: complex I subunit 1 family protein, partial [Bryobacteraceae bacterium]
NELVAGFHVEYSSMKFAAFFMAEYANMVTVTAVATLIFLGGWHAPLPVAYGSGYIPTLLLVGSAAVALYHALHPARPFDRITLSVTAVVFFGLGVLFLVPVLQPILLPLFWFIAKTGFLLFVYIWIRGTLPRFRYDQLMKFAWTFLFPAALLNLLVTALIVAVFPNQ